MLRLRDRFKQIPNGLVFHQPETNFDSIKVLGRHPSLDRLTDALIAHRLGNPWLVKKHKWATERNTVMLEVETYNATICKANGWNDFITDEGASPPKAWPPPSARGGLVAGARKAGGAIKLVVDWLGSGLQPVSLPLAEKRAFVCTSLERTLPDGTVIKGCPLNQDGGFFEKIGALAAQDVRRLIEIKADMALKTSHDTALKSCEACSCFNSLKVWTPLDHIVKNMSEDVKVKLDPQCWVLSELNGSINSPTGQRQGDRNTVPVSATPDSPGSMPG